MMKLPLRLYEWAPHPLKTVMASARGLQLRHWRYGPETPARVQQALDREKWPRPKLEAAQQEQLAEMLVHAATTVPYYRKQWVSRRIQGDRSSWEVLENWPILDKEALRRHPTAFLSEGSNQRLLFHDSTSGSTGKALDLWFGRQTLRSYHGIYEARVRHWHGVSRNESWATMGAKPVAGKVGTGPPYWVRNYPLNQLYLSADRLSPLTAPDFFRILAEVQATHIFGYPSALAYLAAEGRRQGLLPPGLRAVITNAAKLFDWRRELIEGGLGAKAVETYGMTEIVATASECEHGRLHLWPEVGYVEVLADDEDERPLPATTSGRLICTGLLNRDMPLIRYEVGDRGAVAPPVERCPCGRNLPILLRVEGRTTDILIASDGRRVFTADVVSEGLPIIEYQVVQETRSRLHVLVVPAHGFGHSAEETLAARLQDKLGEVDVRIERVERVPPDPSGKTKLTVSHLAEVDRSGTTSD